MIRLALGHGKFRAGRACLVAIIQQHWSGDAATHAPHRAHFHPLGGRMKFTVRSLPAVAALALALSAAFTTFGARVSYAQDPQPVHGQPQPRLYAFASHRAL